MSVATGKVTPEISVGFALCIGGITKKTVMFVFDFIKRVANNFEKSRAGVLNDAIRRELNAGEMLSKHDRKLV